MRTWIVARNYGDYREAFARGRRCSNDEPVFNKVKAVRCYPVINFGYTHVFGNDFCVGGSIETSLGSSKKGNRVVDGEFSEDGKIDGNFWAIKLKGGYRFSKWNTLFYGIVGVKWMDAAFKLIDNPINLEEVKARRTMPIFGIGIEEKICKGISVYSEYEHFWSKSSPKVSALNPGAFAPIVDS